MLRYTTSTGVLNEDRIVPCAVFDIEPNGTRVVDLLPRETGRRVRRKPQHVWPSREAALRAIRKDLLKQRETLDQRIDAISRKLAT